MTSRPKHALREFRAPDEDGAELVPGTSCVTPTSIARRPPGGRSPPGWRSSRRWPRSRWPRALAGRRQRGALDQACAGHPACRVRAVLASRPRARPALGQGRDVDGRRRRRGAAAGPVAAGELVAARVVRGGRGRQPVGGRRSARQARWSLARPTVSDPRWYPPIGWRIAYFSRRDPADVAGDGTGDRLLVADVAPVAPACSPAPGTS